MLYVSIICFYNMLYHRNRFSMHVNFFSFFTEATMIFIYIKIQIWRFCHNIIACSNIAFLCVFLKYWKQLKLNVISFNIASRYSKTMLLRRKVMFSICIYYNHNWKLSLFMFSHIIKSESRCMRFSFQMFIQNIHSTVYPINPNNKMAEILMQSNGTYHEKVSIIFRFYWKSSENRDPPKSISYRFLPSKY